MIGACITAVGLSDPKIRITRPTAFVNIWLFSSQQPKNMQRINRPVDHNDQNNQQNNEVQI